MCTHKLATYNLGFVFIRFPILPVPFSIASTISVSFRYKLLQALSFGKKLGTLFFGPVFPQAKFLTRALEIEAVTGFFLGGTPILGAEPWVKGEDQ